MSRDIDNRLVGVKIACLRRTKGYTQAELAEKVNISLSYMAKIETAFVSNRVSVDVLNKIAYELGVSVDDLIDSDKRIQIV